MGRFNGKTCRMATMFALTLAFFLLEAICGYISHSMALIADSFHMLSDVLALVIAFACMKISKKTHSTRNTFGWVRAEVLGALVNTVFLVALSFSIILQSIERFFEPEPIRNPIQVLIVGVLGLAVNIVGLFLFHGHGGGHGHSHGGGGHGHSHASRKNGHAHSHAKDGEVTQNGHNGRSVDDSQHHDDDHDCDGGDVESAGTVEEPEEQLDVDMAMAVRRLRRKSSIYYFSGEEELDKIAAVAEAAAVKAPPSPTPEVKRAKKTSTAQTSQQMNMHGIWLHVLGDAFGSVVVIVNAVVNWQASHIYFVKNYLDPILSLMMSLIIVVMSIPLLKESAMILLQTVPTHINVQEMKNKLLDQFSHSVEGVHDFHIWRLSGNKIVATAHVRCKGDLDDYMSLAEKIKAFFHYEGIHSTTIQAEMAKGEKMDSKQCALKCPKKKSGVRKCVDEVCCTVPPTPVVETSPALTSPKKLSTLESRFSYNVGTGVPATIVEETQDNHM